MLLRPAVRWSHNGEGYCGVKQYRQSGFSLIGAVLLLAIIVVLAAASWAVYQRVKPSTTTTSTTPHNSTSSNQQSGGTGTQQTQTNLFRIPELGIEITVPDGLKDLKYVVDTTSVSGTTFVRLTTGSLEAIDGESSQCSAAQSALGVMWKTTSNPADTGARATTYKKVGDSYILYDHPQQGCSNVPATNQRQSSQTMLLQAAVQTAQAI